MMCRKVVLLMAEANESHRKFSKASSVCPSTLQHLKIFFRLKHVCNSGSVTCQWQPRGVIYFPQCRTLDWDCVKLVP